MKILFWMAIFFVAVAGFGFYFLPELIYWLVGLLVATTVVVGTLFALELVKANNPYNDDSINEPLENSNQDRC